MYKDKDRMHIGNWAELDRKITYDGITAIGWSYQRNFDTVHNCICSSSGATGISCLVPMYAACLTQLKKR